MQAQYQVFKTKPTCSLENRDEAIMSASINVWE